MLAIAALAFAIASCAGDGNGEDGSKLPPAGAYAFDVTGTMDFELIETGADAASAPRQDTMTGQVNGMAVIDLLADGTGTFGDPCLRWNVQHEGGRISIGICETRDLESTVKVGPEETTPGHLNRTIAAEFGVVTALGLGVVIVGRVF